MSTILIAEDEPMICDWLADVLWEDGHTVFIAHSGSEALVILRSHPEINLLFTDICMPGALDGIALADEAKRMYPGLSVLYATGYAYERVGNNHQPAHGEVLPKPYRPHQILAKIRALGR
jgi:CheY-like chemotaxis protein